MQELIPLEGNGGELKLTVAYYYLPSGRLVHRKKDSTDWGVDPQLAIPLDIEQEKKLVQDQTALDIIRGPLSRPSTLPAGDALLAVDRQLSAGLKAVVEDVDSGKNLNVPPSPTTVPTTQAAAVNRS